MGEITELKGSHEAQPDRPEAEPLPVAGASAGPTNEELAEEDLLEEELLVEEISIDGMCGVY